MTGFGEAHCKEQGLFVTVEVRSINNKYFKLTLRASEGYGSLEGHVESLLREQVKRGSIQVSLRIERQARPDDYTLNLPVLSGYRKQLEQLRDSFPEYPEPSWDALLALPGVVDEHPERRSDLDSVWPVVRTALEAALVQFARMRIDEGDAMLRDLKENTRLISRELSAIEARAPAVVEAYRTRLKDRLSSQLAEHGITVQTADVVREVGLFAERSDIAEECVRLRSHLDQFALTLDEKESSGRKLDFLTQEMFRETNTIGSKAGDAQIARHVIEIKSAVERLREMIQNVE